MADAWTPIATGDNDPGEWVDGIEWNDDEAWNDGWIVVDRRFDVWTSE